MDVVSHVGSTASGPAARRARVSLGRAAAAGLQQQLEVAQQARHREDIDWIVARLEGSSQLSLMVCAFIDAGGQASLAPKDEFPRGVRRLSQIPVRDTARGLCIMLDLPKERLDCLDRYDEDVHHLFFFANGLSSNFPVSTRGRADFFGILRNHYIQGGSRLTDFFWDPDGITIDWTYQLGRFLLIREAGGSAKYIRDVWGARYLDLPVEVPATRLHTLQIKNNWNYREAKLVGQLNHGIESAISLCDMGWENAHPWQLHAGIAASSAGVAAAGPPALADNLEEAIAAGDEPEPEGEAAAAGHLEGEGVGEELPLPA